MLQYYKFPHFYACFLNIFQNTNYVELVLGFICIALKETSLVWMKN